MSVARLTALRLVGFKSFAERTTVEFGPGISAVVGPNGSGKSNLADALRWTLGEQGRGLRTRRSEDVIFAGSSTRRAIGMADVTLVIDNHDRLLPVDYGEVEIGRRLYRSGENEYLLNRQKIRLRDLVELLDAGNLADNAFLFIGQGMVDQALALRPEERRPLFEEAAGVRRHERRRRQAEAELTEAESNLERLRDLLGELRPQARRLSAQAEQLQARRTAGVDLAEALLAAARARWVGASATATREQTVVDQARAAADTALAELNRAEDLATTVSGQIGAHGDLERKEREVLDRKRTEIVELRVGLARIESESTAMDRDRQRVTAEMGEAERRIAAASATLAEPGLERDEAASAELELLERQLAEHDAALTAGDGSPQASADRARRELAARTAERRQHEARSIAVSSSLREQRSRLERLAGELAEGERARTETVARLEAAVAAETAAATALDAARASVDKGHAERSAATQLAAELEAEATAARARLAALEAVIDPDGERGLARAARARGGQLIGEGLEVEPRFRTAVAAALGDAGTAWLVAEAEVVQLAQRRGVLALGKKAARRDASRLAQAGADVLAAAGAAGGGSLVDAIRRDPNGKVSELLERVVWLPELGGALALRQSLPAGWRAVTLAGEVVAEDGLVSLARERSEIDIASRRAAEEAGLAELEPRLEAARAAAQRQAGAGSSAAEALREAARAADAARTEHRRAAEAERVAQRRAEQLVREHAWLASQVERLGAEAAGISDLLARLDEQVVDLEGRLVEGAPSAAREDERRQSVARLRSRRDELQKLVQEHAARAAANDEARRRAEISLALDEARVRDLDAEVRRVGERDIDLGARRTELTEALAVRVDEERKLAAALDELVRAGADDRARLMSAERTAVDARERLRASETARREAEMRAMEARLQSDQLREQLLVELASIGADGLATLRHAAGASSDSEPTEPAEAAGLKDSIDSDGESDDEGEVGQLEELLDSVVARWRAEPSDEMPPSPGKIASLRRRFHDLGAGNPFAAEEYAELNERLTTLEAQRTDMEAAITATRELISSLSALINDQFRTTFAALEDAFARRFHELFGGGEAQLSLTAPDDLSATGIEIHARPPGKKRQPLSMLSGGERALTAVSLLLAMLEVRPVPFCVLDEVDAALDEANVTRFSKALRGLAEQTQFIVITHNRGTIEGADALYGVTIGDDAVSRVISLRLPRNGAGGKGDSTDELLEQAGAAAT
ncbi:MAG TPA: chromosome segregation protein SMC [Candidatus Limnocylindrales bacterium]|nr:chromosome segregation protein SMC [Candidatus Limnocylindrales bacterium]